MLFMGRTLVFSTCFCWLLAAGSVATAQRQDTALVAYLRQHQAELRLSGGQLQGAAASWFRREAANAAFLFIGEEHDIREVPQIVGALWQELALLGYNHIALEAGQWLGNRLDRYARFNDRQALGQFKAAAWPRRPNVSVPPVSEEDLAFYEVVSRIARPRTGPAFIWGLDHEFKVAPLLRRLAELTPQAGLRRQVEELLVKVEVAEKNNRYNMQPFKTNIQSLIRSFTPVKEDETAYITDALERRISGNRYDQERGDVMKQLFMRQYRAAQQPGGQQPKVLLRFGSYHAKRGLMSDFGTSTLANFVAEIAFSEGARMLNVKIVCCSDTATTQAAHPRPCSGAERIWLQPMRAAASYPWTLYDLRDLRQKLQQGSLQAGYELAEAIYGFDAVLLLQTCKPVRFSP
jgi:hypothetical protein